MNLFFLNDVGGFRFGPDEPAGGSAAAVAPATQAASTPAPSSPSPAAPAAGQTTTVPAASSGSTEGTAGTSTPGAAPAAAAQSWLDSFRAAGFQTQETDESRVRAQLIQDARDAQQLRAIAPLATEYQQHQQEFQQYLAERQKNQKVADGQNNWTKELGWNPPEYDPTWVTQLKRNEDGSITALPGAPADLPMKYQRYQQWRQGEVDKLMADPFKYMEPAIRKIAGEIASKQAEQNVGTYKEQVEAQSFIQKNSDWLFERDGQGGYKSQQRFNAQTGRYDTDKVLSPHGKMFVERLQEYSRQGLSPEQQNRFAFNDVRLAYMESGEYTSYLLSKQPAGQQGGAAAGGATPETARQQANAAFIQKSNPATPPAPSAGGNATPAPLKVTRENMHTVLLQRMKEQGVTVQ